MTASEAPLAGVRVDRLVRFLCHKYSLTILNCCATITTRSINATEANMSKTSRWDEVCYNKAEVTDRERLKRRGAAKICTQRDRLAEREKYSAKNFAFGALWALAVSKGKTNDWWAAKVEALYSREDCRLFDVMRRIGAVYIKFLPQRAFRG